jgi:hypothetical protein
MCRSTIARIRPSREPKWYPTAASLACPAVPHDVAQRRTVHTVAGKALFACPDQLVSGFGCVAGHEDAY